MRTNEKFERYYKNVQQIVPEAEWDAFLKCLQTPLPLTFRFSAGEPSNTRKRKLSELKHISTTAKRLKSLPWAPGETCWQLPVSYAERSELRRSYPQLKAFLKRESGRTVTYQEAVSLVPALMLNVHSDHFVLDMCAAPGSKTSAMLESAMRTARLGGVDHQPRGALVANDLDAKRGHVLVHNCKRVGSNALIVTHCPAERFPDAFGTFDRIMCDVPCSGDGTLRKEPSIWSKWSPRNGMELHPLQASIAKRGANLLKIGGIMAYSTCSLNPIENEAVVCEILRASRGALKLLDTTKRAHGIGTLPLLKRRPGMTTWSVVTSDMKRVDPESSSGNTTFPRSMFPPTEEERKRFKLRRCVRLCPTDQDTGGFFVALFRRRKEGVVVGGGVPRPLSKSDEVTSSETLRPFPDDRTWRELCSFYGIDATAGVRERLFTRGSGRRYHLLSRGAAKIIQGIRSSSSTTSSSLASRVEYVGAYALERCGRGPDGNGVPYRLAQEGIAALLPYMDASSRVVRLSAKAMLSVLATLPSNLSSRQWEDLVRRSQTTTSSSSTRRDFKHSVDFRRIPVRSLPYENRSTIASPSFSPGCFVLAPDTSLSLDASFAVVAWLSGGRKETFSIEHAGWGLQTRLESMRVVLAGA